MIEVVNKFKVDLNAIMESEDGNQYDIVIQIPMELGWIEDVKLILDDSLEYQMDYFKSENDMAFFKTEVFLATKAIYHYYFCSLANNQLIYLKNNIFN